MVVRDALYRYGAAGAVALILFSTAALVSSGRESAGYQPSLRTTSGPELLLVYITSPTCGACQHSELPDAIEKTKVLLRETARAHGYAFAAIGVAQSMSVSAGLEHLERLGEFDEVSAGRGWIGLGPLRYMIETIPGRAATPQVVVTERIVTRGDGPISVSPERLLARKSGVQEILHWLELGAPLPTLGVVER